MKALILVGMMFTLGAQAQVLRPAEPNGILVKKTIAQGSRSEREALVLKTMDEVEIVIRVKGDSAFGINKELAKYVGELVSCRGFLDMNTSTLLNSECEVLSNYNRRRH